jgi:DNA-binding GntR family transcriptional regulator
LRKSNLVTLAHTEIHRRIMVGELREGEKIVLLDLAQEFGTSMIPLREALARLTAERLVTYEPNKGFRVAPAPDADEIAHLFEARLVMELGALEVGMDAVTPEIIAALTEINDRIRSQNYGESFNDFKGFIADNAEFHAILIGLTGNPLVIDAYQRLGYHERIPLTLHGRGVQDVGRIISEHDRIIAALQARSLDDARAALKAHILDAYARLPVPAGHHSLRPLKVSMPAR